MEVFLSREALHALRPSVVDVFLICYDCLSSRWLRF